MFIVYLSYVYSIFIVYLSYVESKEELWTRKKEKKSLRNQKKIPTFALANGADAAHCR